MLTAPGPPGRRRRRDQWAERCWRGSWLHPVLEATSDLSMAIQRTAPVHLLAVRVDAQAYDEVLEWMVLPLRASLRELRDKVPEAVDAMSCWADC